MGKYYLEKKSIEPGVLYAIIDRNKIKESRRSIPIKDHQRIFFDTSSLNHDNEAIEKQINHATTR